MKRVGDYGTFPRVCFSCGAKLALTRSPVALWLETLEPSGEKRSWCFAHRLAAK